jgi:hypothetical protein
MNDATAQIKALLQKRDFSELFIEELGWDNPKFGEVEIELDGDQFEFTPIAQKEGFTVFTTSQSADHVTRQKLHRRLSERAAEHFVIYGTSEGVQYWQWTETRPGGTPRQVLHEWHPDRENVALIERLNGIKFDLAEQGHLTVLGVRRRVGAAFSADAVSGTFYNDFQDEHRELLKQIQGIDIPSDLEWYGSVLLNRLMFLYFIQKRGYLSDDPDYLRTRFEAVREARGEGHFYTFFKRFLLPLFHDALARKDAELEDDDLAELVGDVPYVNGGFFSVHELEERYDIDVTDDAFARIFDLFDSYRWHLSEVPEQDERAINPDVLGYVFERYINQKEKGAYYTKTDVTRFMVRSALIPVFLDKWESIAGNADMSAPRWQLLTDTPELYVPEGLSHGIDADVPAGIKDGRGRWPTPPALLVSAPDEAGLPAETWLETLDRHDRYAALVESLRNGEIRDSSEAVTANISISRFAVDAILSIEDVHTALAVLDLLQGIRVLDPTCGSGAFLFAALNVLEELYEALLLVLRELPVSSDVAAERRRQERLAEIDQHASTEYFIAKSAALHNLFGVDLMHEAVEIAKLRLFLKLVSGLADRSELEPLPDLDLNLRAGNTVVGFVSKEQAVEALSGNILAATDLPAFEDGCAQLVDHYEHFVELQTGSTDDGSDVAEAKQTLISQEKALAKIIDDALARQRGVDPKDQDTWWERERPFHWFLEFGGAIRRGGFDCVVGNPPYRKLSAVRSEYAVEGFATGACSDLYAPMTERAGELLCADGRLAFVVPISVTFGEEFGPLRGYLQQRFELKWISSYGTRPSALFDGDVGVRPTIIIAAPGHTESLWTTRTHRWTAAGRPTLFDTLFYTGIPASLRTEQWPKCSHSEIAALLVEMSGEDRARLGDSEVKGGEFAVAFQKTGRYFLSAYRTAPPKWDAGGNPLEQNANWMRFSGALARDAALLAGAGKLMFVWWTVWGDDFNVPLRIVSRFPLDLALATTALALEITDAAGALDEAMQDNIFFTTSKGGKIGNYRMHDLREFTDRGDAAVSELLGVGSYMASVELAFQEFAKGA